MNVSRAEYLSRLPPARHWTLLAIGGGAVLLIACGIAAFVWPHALARSYLFAYVFWLNVSLGSLGWLMLSHVTGGAWGRTTRRYFEAAVGLLPWLAILGLPLLAGASTLYPWAEANEWSHDAVLMHRRPWISLGWVATRAAVAFAAWVAIGWSLRRASLAQDRARDPDTVLALGQRMRTISQGGCVVLFASVELLGVDWVMSLEPHWYSSIFGLILLTGQSTAAISGVVLVLWASERVAGRPLVSADRVHDLGKLLLTSLVLWAYMSFAQYLVQWMGQTQEDVPWYVHRLHGGWSWVATSLCVLGLGVPLAMLLSRPLKRSLTSLAVVAAWVFVMRVVDVLWTIAPSGPHGSVGPAYITDVFAWLGLGGVWVGVFGRHLSRASRRPAAYLTSGANVTGAIVDRTEVADAV